MSDKTTPFTVRIPEALMERLQRRAKTNDRSVGWIIRRYLWDATDNDAEVYGELFRPHRGDPS